MNLQELENLLKTGKDIEEILKKQSWKEFEDIVAQILVEHGFEVERNFRFTLNKKRHEIDIIAKRFDEILCIDCKKWNIRPGKKTAIKAAAKKQVGRTKKYKKFAKLKSKNICPMVITFLDEDIVLADKVPVIPVWKLNDFMNDFSEYQNDLRKI